MRSLPSAMDDPPDTPHEHNAVFSQFLGSASMAFFLFSFPCFLLTLFTIAPPSKQRFAVTNVSWLLDTKEVAIKSRSLYIFLFARDYRSMTSWWQGASQFRRYGRELVSKPVISLKKSLGGYRNTTLLLSCIFLLLIMHFLFFRFYF